MSPQEATVGLSVLTVASAGVNIYVGLRLAALQAKLKADSATLEIALLRQFVTWKDEVLTAINGKYVSAQLVSEIRTSLAHEVASLAARVDHIERRCEDRPKDCITRRCQGTRQD